MHFVVKQRTLLYHDLNYVIVIGPTRVTWCAKINNVARIRQCSVTFPGNMVWRDPCSRGTWRKPPDTMHLRRFFGPTTDCNRATVLGSSIRFICCCVTDDDTNLLHLFRNITKQILTLSLDQHIKILGSRTTLHYFGALFFNVALGTSQYS